MIINKFSVSRLLGNNKKNRYIAVYGMDNCLASQVANVLTDQSGCDQHGFEIYYRTDDKFNSHAINYDHKKDGRDKTRSSTTEITSLLIENYNHFKRGDALIPLIFCVAREEDDKKIELDINLIISQTGKKSPAIYAELRRCYKIYSEMGPEIKAIAELTFKFVSVVKHGRSFSRVNISWNRSHLSGNTQSGIKHGQCAT